MTPWLSSDLLQIWGAMLLCSLSCISLCPLLPSEPERQMQRHLGDHLAHSLQRTLEHTGPEMLMAVPEITQAVGGGAGARTRTQALLPPSSAASPPPALPPSSYPALGIL